MPRQAKIRRPATRKIQSKPQPVTIQPLHNPDIIKTKRISVKCMNGCGTNVYVTVPVDSIDPKKGRPRGLRIRCHNCNMQVRAHSSGMTDTYIELC